jgi:DnaD/phage-associated family protein
MTTYEVRDAGDPRKYFIQIPNIIDDMNLSPYAIRLYIHLKRVTGEDGKCWQSIKTLSKFCNVSEGMIVKARKELVSRELISIERRTKEDGSQDSLLITINDIWENNILAYKNNGVYHAVTGGVSLSEGGVSPHDKGGVSLSEGGVSLSELKNNPVKNNPLMQEEPIKEDNYSRPNIFKTYEQSIGLLTPRMADILQQAETDYPEDWINEAFDLAVKANVRKWSYIDRILRNWSTDGKGNGSSPAKIDMKGYTEA